MDLIPQKKLIFFKIILLTILKNKKAIRRIRSWDRSPQLTSAQKYRPIYNSIKRNKKSNT